MQDILQRLNPVWNDSGLAYKESVCFIEENGSISAGTYYAAEKIISLTSADETVEYVLGEDYLFEDGRLVLTTNSRIPYFTQAELYPSEATEKSYGGKDPIPLVIFGEGTFFHTHQCSVTYLHSDMWRGDLPQVGAYRLKRTSSILQNGDPLKLLVYGDSIPAGGNASGCTGIEPYQPAFGELIAEGIREKCGCEVECINTAVGGTATPWALEEVEERAVRHHPDLAIIAFGMNDGSGNIPPQDFRNNIKGIIDAIRRESPDCEFILFSSILPNAEACLAGIQGEYPPVLRSLEDRGVVLADMYSVHAELLSAKRYIDMTGNNVNHPNDYVHRVYAQIALCALGI